MSRNLRSKVQRCSNNPSSTSDTKMSTGADLLPREILVKIFSYLSYPDLLRVQHVCTWWQQVSWDKCLWSDIIYNPCNSSKEVIKTLKESPQLQALDLISVEVDTALIECLIDHCPNLERLFIFWDSLYNYSEVSLTRPLKNIRILSLLCEEELYMDFPYLHKYFPNLEELEMPRLRFQKKELIAYLVKKKDLLHSLTISCSTDEGQCVLPCLPPCKELTHLSLFEVCEKVHTMKSKDVFHLRNITYLKIAESKVNRKDSDTSIFAFFPNTKEIEMYGCVQGKEDTLQVIARNCPKLQKMEVTYHYSWHGPDALMQDVTLKYAHHLQKLTHLTLRSNGFVTDEGLKLLQKVPQLVFLKLIQCDKLSLGALKILCGFGNLQVIQYDLRSLEPPTNLTYEDLKNKDLQIMFFNCRNVSSLEYLRQQRFRICILEEMPS